jgi:hypothetical protein
VRVRSKDDQRITIGTRAASKVLVHVAAATLLVLALTTSAFGQTQPQAAPFAIMDNSFLVEEAFNQEPGIFQSIVTARRGEDDTWEAAFTQEWPLFTQTHQLSFTVGALGIDGERGLDDLLINYRWQATTESAAAPAFSPRVSLILATGDASKGLGGGGTGWQVNLPFSKQFNDTYVHSNAGFTHTPAADGITRDHNLFNPHLALSGIRRIRPMFTLVLESVLEWEQFVESDTTRRDTVFTLSPGFQTGWNVGDTQTIVGLAIPVAISDGNTSVSVFGYFSYELPFIQTQL